MRALQTVSIFLSIIFVASFVSAAVLFEDNFDDGVADGWTPEDGIWAVENGVYTQKDIQWVERQTKPSPPGNWSDFVLEFDTRVVQGDVATAYIRLNGNAQTHDYMLIMGPSDLRFGRHISSKYVDLEQIVMDWDLSQWHSIKIIADGPSMMVFVDGMLKIDVVDATFSNGNIAFGTWNAEGHFDNIVVSTLYQCGDGTCDASETCETCPVDCGLCPPTLEVRVSTLEDIISDLNAENNSLKEENSIQNQRLDLLESLFNLLEDSISALGLRVDTLEESIAGLNASFTELIESYLGGLPLGLRKDMVCSVLVASGESSVESIGVNCSLDAKGKCKCTKV